MKWRTVGHESSAKRGDGEAPVTDTSITAAWDDVMPDRIVADDERWERHARVLFTFPDLGPVDENAMRLARSQTVGARAHSEALRRNR